MNKEIAVKEEKKKKAPDGFIWIDHTFVDRFGGDKEVTFDFLFKRPTKGACERAQGKMTKKPGAAFRNLCVSCVHEDSKDNMLAAFDKFPGLPTSFGNALLEAAGFGDLRN